MSKRFEWVEISNDHLTYTYVMDLVHTCVMKVMVWDTEKDSASYISITEIDRAAGQLAIKFAKE